MRLIDADKFLGFLIFSKHIDSLTCHEVKEAVEMCKVDVLEKIRAEIDVARFIDKDTKLCKNANASGLEVAMQIIDKYR